MSRFVLAAMIAATGVLGLLAASCGGGSQVHEVPTRDNPIDDGEPAPVADVPVLPSWNEGPAKRAIVDFVARVTDSTGPDYRAPAERIATFDNDGTLWTEQPIYVQVAFAIDRVKALASEHPEWATTEPYASALKDDLHGVLSGGTHGLVGLIMATHAGMTDAEFADIARAWITTARHPKTGRLYTEMVYRPMLELLDYLRANGFKTYIVSGGGIELMRVFAEEVYGIPPEQVIGSSIKTELDSSGERPVIRRLPEIDFVDDKEGKPLAINKFIGRRPIAAFGNSDGDLQMLQWTAAGDGARFVLIVHHTDADREWAYDRESHIGRLDKALDEANSRDWTVVSMEADWATIYGSE
jgi:phosphoserine phosphatase